MDSLYLLVPMSVLLALFILLVFAWALKSGQFDDMEREGLRILDADQGAAEPASEESPSILEDEHGDSKTGGSLRL